MAMSIAPLPGAMSDREAPRRRKRVPRRLSFSLASCLLALLCALPQFLGVQRAAAAAGATTSVHLARYGSDGSTVLAGRTVDYRWMEKNLPVQGDGVTHYYHQGPVFEGDIWDPGEAVNLKDKGPVKGTDIRDLCELVGGMSPDDEIMLRAVDGWSTTLAYANVYEPSARQGPLHCAGTKAVRVAPAKATGPAIPEMRHSARPFR